MKNIIALLLAFFVVNSSIASGSSLYWGSDVDTYNTPPLFFKSLSTKQEKLKKIRPTSNAKKTIIYKKNTTDNKINKTNIIEKCHLSSEKLDFNNFINNKKCFNNFYINDANIEYGEFLLNVRNTLLELDGLQKPVTNLDKKEVEDFVRWLVVQFHHVNSVK